MRRERRRINTRFPLGGPFSVSALPPNPYEPAETVRDLPPPSTSTCAPSAGQRGRAKLNTAGKQYRRPPRVGASAHSEQLKALVTSSLVIRFFYFCLSIEFLCLRKIRRSQLIQKTVHLLFNNLDWVQHKCIPYTHKLPPDCAVARPRTTCAQL